MAHDAPGPGPARGWGLRHAVLGAAGATVAALGLAAAAMIDSGAAPSAGTAVAAADAAGAATLDRVAYVADGDRSTEIFVRNLDGSAVVQLTANGTMDRSPQWSPDGRRIAFVSDARGNLDIWVMNADGTDERPVTTDPADDLHPAWDPDGRRLAFASQRNARDFVEDRDGNSELYVVDLETGTETRMTADADEDVFPSWSPDGTRLAFASNRAGSYAVYVLTLADGSVRRLSGGPGNVADTAWSPDGARIAFTYAPAGFRPDQVAWIGIVDAASGDVSWVTQANNRGDSDPTWSPDGDRLVFVSFRDGQPRLYAINADGTNEIPLSATSLREFEPAWAPAPR